MVKEYFPILYYQELQEAQVKELFNTLEQTMQGTLAYTPSVHRGTSGYERSSIQSSSAL